MSKTIYPLFFERGNKENCPAHWRKCFLTDRNHFELNQDIIKTNILTNFELGRDFIGTKLLTKFYEDGTRNVASRTGHKSSPEQSGELKRHDDDILKYKNWR
ncbi:hypothetical protein DPMN_055531 [Dreissena polymorpha]|uniref:Uncharacterized protein n=1 Tax=Dreissena polymorpha TaxID=45954 RepID=A0A9D4CSS7_DREPO|nr:hypothetical protein DPMN_055531 [Dreissena polymorpha]